MLCFLNNCQKILVQSFDIVFQHVFLLFSIHFWMLLVLLWWIICIVFQSIRLQSIYWFNSDSSKIGTTRSVRIRSRLESFGVVERRPESSGVIQNCLESSRIGLARSRSRPESFGVIQSHPESSRIELARSRSRPESFGVIQSHPELDSPVVEVVRGCPESLGVTWSRQPTTRKDSERLRMTLDDPRWLQTIPRDAGRLQTIPNEFG